MVSTPQPHAAPQPPAKVDQPPVAHEEVVKTVGQEQLERSEEMEREGIENWKRRNDMRNRENNDKPHAAKK